MLTSSRINFSKEELIEKSYSLIPASFYLLDNHLLKSMDILFDQWNFLEVDNYLKSKVPFRYRRLGYFKFIPKSDHLSFFSDNSYFQDMQINSYVGGIRRIFAQINDTTINNSFLLNLIKINLLQFPLNPEELDKTWKVDVHLFRVIANNLLSGFPSPEGIHRDGDQFEAIHLVKRENIIGGKNQIYTNDKKYITSFTLLSPLDTLLLVDNKVMHCVTEIKQQDSNKIGFRDALVIGYNQWK